VRQSRLGALVLLVGPLLAGGPPSAVARQGAAPPPPPASAAAEPESCLRSGPLLGPVETGEVTVWLQTRRACRAQLRFWETGKPGTARLSAEIATTEAGDLIARFGLTGLSFGTPYDYELYLDGRRVERPYPLSFETQALWQYRTAPPDVRAAVGSCAYINEPAYDRPGTPYGGGYEIFETIARQQPDLMVWLGDDIYYREADVITPAGMRRRWAVDRSLPELQPLWGSVPSYAIWDDHDFGPNDADRTFPLREESLRIFKDYWMNPSYGTLETPGVFGRFTWSDAEFFLLDDRFYRAPESLPDGPEKRMFGAGQLRWLEESLLSSRATWKIVATGSQMWNDHTRFETFAHFPGEQKELLDFLRTAKIEGVIFVTGDRHHTELLKRQEPGLYPLYELTSSPLTSGASQLREEKDNPLRVPGTWVTGTRNFGLIEITGPEKDRVLTLRTLDTSGKELWRHRIARRELSFPSGGREGGE
jgi:alkaline phosphatase D